MSNIVALPQQRYTSDAIRLHWLMAGLIVLAVATGLLFDDIPKAWEQRFLNIHAILGVIILALLAIRISWRLKHQPPPLPASIGPLNRLASHYGHLVLYGLMAVVPLAGLVTLLARGTGIDFGLFEILSPLARTPEIARPAKQLHGLLAYALIAMALGHMAVAMVHQFVLRDGLLARMMPKRAGTAGPIRKAVKKS